MFMKNFPSQEAIDIYNYFKTLPGSEHIGKPVSIDALIQICGEIKPQRVLEMGGGIGALSCTLLKYSNAFLDIYEDNEFCIGELRKNLAEYKERFQIISAYNVLPPSKNYDLVVIDGGTGTEGDGGYSLAARLFLLYIDSVKVVYLEGYRGMQRRLARLALREKYVCRYTPYKEIYVEGKKWHGGLKIVCRLVRSGFVRWTDFCFWELSYELRRWYFRIKNIGKSTKSKK